MRIIIILIVFWGSCKTIYAQLEPQYTLYWNNFSVYNPAATAFFGKHYTAINGRQQWKGLEGAPITTSLLYDRKLDVIHGGIGLNYYYDVIGLITSNKININYSYQLRFDKNRMLNFGIAGGFYRMNLDGSRFVARDLNDPSIPKGGTETKFNANFGVMYQSDHWLLGLNSTQLTKPYFKKLKLRSEPHYYFSCMFRTNLTGHLEIKPGVLLKTTAEIGQLDVNLLFTFKKRIWAGITYRLDNTTAYMGGVDINGKYRIGYAYDYTPSILSKGFFGSHEIIFAFMVN